MSGTEFERGNAPAVLAAAPGTIAEGGEEDPTVVLEAFASGSFFGDRFRLGRALGSGAMGRVFEAIDLHTEQEVALKVLHPDRSRDPEAVERFAREAEILAAVGHPGIVKVVAVGRAPDGTPWLAMERLRGVTLDERIRAGPMGLEEVVPVLNTICDALAAAHLRGIVHRDLKPENVLLLEAPPPVCKILDFGLSRLAATKALTRAGTVIGTPRYMAPEQLSSAFPVDFRADVYAVGILLYEMLAGRSPYPAEDMKGLLGCVMAGRMVPLTDVRPDLPPAISEVIARATARDPRDRFSTAGAIAEAYANAIGIRSGRSSLALFPALPSREWPLDEGAKPLLVDPFDPGERIEAWSRSPEPSSASTVRGKADDRAVVRFSSSVPPTACSAAAVPSALGEALPTRHPAGPASAARGLSRPGSSSFTRPLTSERLPSGRPRWKALGRHGILFAVFMIVTISVASAAAIAIRAAIDGRVDLTWLSAQP